MVLTYLQDRIATVERVVCKVLLGQPESALESLGLAEGAAVPRCNMTVCLFSVYAPSVCATDPALSVSAAPYVALTIQHRLHVPHTLLLCMFFQDSTALLCQLQ